MFYLGKFNLMKETLDYLEKYHLVGFLAEYVLTFSSWIVIDDSFQASDYNSLASAEQTSLDVFQRERGLWCRKYF